MLQTKKVTFNYVYVLFFFLHDPDCFAFIKICACAGVFAHTCTQTISFNVCICLHPPTLTRPPSSVRYIITEVNLDTLFLTRTKKEISVRTLQNAYFFSIIYLCFSSFVDLLYFRIIFYTIILCQIIGWQVVLFLCIFFILMLF